jgi:alpha-tubulin suppressor-like RCC1 family protein
VGSTPAIAVRDLAAGGDSTCAQPMSGGIQCWGAVVHGSGAYAIAGTETAVAFDVASYYACAVLTDGTLRCWGLNGGTFGNGTSAAWTLEAVAGATTLTSLVDVAVDDNYSCVLDAAGAVYCTGSIGLDGTLGLSPVRIAGLPPLVSLSAGRVHACGLDAGGTVHCWGQNSLAKFAAQLPPAGNAIDVAAPLADASSVAAGGTRTCAIRRDGTARCWGDDQRGAGDGFPRARFVPGLPFADSVAAGSGGCAAGARGVWCWGANWWSQAGVGTQTVLETSPVRALADIRVRAMQRGGIDTTTSVATAAGALWYWGEELPTDEHESPRPPVELSANATFVDVAVGVGHGCALADDGHVWCWGENFSGQIGDGSLADTREPHMVAGLDGAVAIAAGFHSCALRTDGSVWCWGYGLGGALGPGGLDETNPSPIRVDVPPMIAIGAAWDYTCGLGKLGDLLCWGSNNPAPRSFGTFPGATRLHAGTRTACVETPTALECVAPRGIGVPRSQPLTGIVEVGLGDADSTSCAVLVSGETYCWGTREMLGAGRLAHAPKIVTGRWAR